MLLLDFQLILQVKNCSTKWDFQCWTGSIDPRTVCISMATRWRARTKVVSVFFSVSLEYLATCPLPSLSRLKPRLHQYSIERLRKTGTQHGYVIFQPSLDNVIIINAA